MKYVITLIVALIPFLSFGQHPNHQVWIFGAHAGVDFSTQPPTPLTSASEGWEAFASQCDEQGNLLFYSNGEQIWNKLHSVMQNGNSILGNYSGSTSQGVITMPHPANSEQYIVLTLNGEETYSQYPLTHGSLYYSVVDMTLNNGLGDVVQGQKNILIDSLFSEHMMIVGTECKMWLVAHTARGGGFRCYEVNSQGINTTPVISNSGTSGNNFKYIRGEMAYDPVRQRIFLSTPDSTYMNGILEMHDFNLNTGIVSNPQLLDASHIYYRLCTSPGGTKLYATGASMVTAVLDQYDVSLNTVQDIINSKVSVVTSQNQLMEDMAVAPDGKIYGSPGPFAQSTLFCISDPEMPGLACNLILNAITLAPNTANVGGVPSPCVKRFIGNSQDTHNSHDTTICNAQLTLTAPDITYDQYVWSTGDTGTSVFVTQPGTYWLVSVDDCKTRTDTFHVADFAFEPQVHDTTICFASSAVLTAPVSLPDYLWSDGSTGSEMTVTQPGTYWVFATDFCLETVDTFHVSFENFTVSLPGDTIVCDEVSITPAVDVEGATYLWQDGSSNTSYSVNTSGSYWVEVSKNGCSRADTMIVENINFEVNLGNDTLLCDNASITLGVTPGYNYLWQDGSTDNKYIVNSAGTYSVRADNIICFATDSITVTYEKCDCNFGIPTIFTPNADGKNDFFKPVIETSCPVSEYTFYIYNRWGEMVFSATSQSDKWDGSYKGQLADVGTYMYMLQFKGAKGKTFTQKGDVTLMR